MKIIKNILSHRRNIRKYNQTNVIIIHCLITNNDSICGFSLMFKYFEAGVELVQGCSHICCRPRISGPGQSRKRNRRSSAGSSPVLGYTECPLHQPRPCCCWERTFIYKWLTSIDFLLIDLFQKTNDISTTYKIYHSFF